MLWNLPESSGICWTLLESAGIRRTPLDSAGICWNLPDSTGLCWNPLESARIHWTLLESTGIHWTLLDRSTGLCLVRFCRFWWNLVISGGFWGTPSRPDMRIWPMSHSQSLGFGSTGICRNLADHVGECTVLASMVPHQKNSIFS